VRHLAFGKGGRGKRVETRKNWHSLHAGKKKGEGISQTTKKKREESGLGLAAQARGKKMMKR